MENINVENEIEKYLIAPAYSVCKVGHDYWFITRMNRCLYKMNLESGKVTIEAVLGRKDGYIQFGNIIHYKDKLILTPRLSSEICTYNLKTKVVNTINICNRDKIEASLFFSSCQAGKYLFFIPVSMTSLLIFDMDAETYESVPLVQRETSKDLLICFEKADKLGNYLFIPFKSEKCILKYNIESKTIERLYPGNEAISYSSIYFIGGKGWLIPFDVTNSIRVWDIETNEIERVIPMPDSIIEQLPSENKAAFFRTYYKDGKLFLCAYNIEDSVIVDIGNFTTKTWNMPYDTEICRPNTGDYLHRISDVFEDDGRIYFINGITGEWFYFENDILKRLEIRTNFVADDMRGGIYNDNLNSLFSLVNFSNNEMSDLNNIGENIYSAV